MKALILVDIQNDFLPGGSLAVERGDELVPIANALMPEYSNVVATQDWHPVNHVSFASQHPRQSENDSAPHYGHEPTYWPDHCVQGTHGAALADGLDLSRVQHVVHKGTDRARDSYSGFFNSTGCQKSDLEPYLRAQHVYEVHLVGLTTDYCVKSTALDAARLGFRTVVFSQGIRGVELRPGDCVAAIEEMRAAGVTVR
jgi:nicotinamidase/pyrazinamidase